VSVARNAGMARTSAQIQPNIFFIGCSFPGEMTPGGSVAISFSEAATTFQFHR